MKLLTKCKKDYYNNLFVKMEGEKTTKGLYSLTKELCGLKDGSLPQTFQKDGKMYR